MKNQYGKGAFCAFPVRFCYGIVFIHAHLLKTDVDEDDAKEKLKDYGR